MVILGFYVCAVLIFTLFGFTNTPYYIIAMILLTIFISFVVTVYFISKKGSSINANNKKKHANNLDTSGEF